MPKKYRITKDGTNSARLPAGTICYECVMYDYGLSSDDTRALGIRYVSVTLDPAGGYPSFTVQESSLEQVPP